MMRVSIERLRGWLLVGAGLLVIVIAAFLGYAHMRAHRFLKDLPGRLGVDITRESNGFTYSQSSKGKTVYTIHAAKMVQRKDGKTTLRDVGIVLYGQRQDRADRIYGSEFEYDQKAGVVRAMGEVHLDLQAPAPADARGRAEYAAGREPASGSGHSDAHFEGDEQMVHVKTSGLVFVQSLGVASTDQEIEFQYHGLNGRAKGADYNSDTGVTVLQSEVRVSGLRDGLPVLLTAAHAEMNRDKGELALQRARYLSIGDKGTAKESGRTLTAEQAVVHMRGDGSVDRVRGSGGVSLAEAGGMLRAQNADVAVGAESRPELVHVAGGVTYAEEGSLRQVEGRAGQGTSHFDGAGRVVDAVMSDSAEMHVRERASESAAWDDRTISGARIEMRFATAEGGKKQWMHDATVKGDARMLLVDRNSKGAGPEESTSELRGESLAAQMVWDGRSARLSHVSGGGHTTLRRTDLKGGEDTSSGETLDVSFATATPGGKEGVLETGTAARVSRAVQSGDVRLTHRPATPTGSKADSPVTEARADQATFQGEGQMLTLNGRAQVAQGDSLLRAQTVRLRQDTSDVAAEGSVSATYRQAGSAEPIHVLSTRAAFTHDGGTARFDGDRGAPARLWQGASQVEAPVIEFNQAEKTLSASAVGPGDTAGVRTVLVSGGGAGGRRERQHVMRISSRSLRYSDADRRAQFGGGVVLQDADGTVRASEVTALLRPATAAVATGAATAGKQGFMGGSVDRVTAEGAVELNQQGRRASGERLVYTATDGLFVMTGTAAVPPKVVDEVQGSVTGAALQFHAGDNSVMVLGNGKGGEGRRVRTETEVRQP